MRLYAGFFKILFDKLAALLVLLFFSPVLLVLMFLVWLDFRENPFFLQKRIGKDCKVFSIFKFKKMRPGDGPEDQRMTGLGRFIRRSSLDELPQFINILTGQMSLIGPRPLLARYLPYYTPLERLRHCVRPGLTGWAQVHGRTALEWTARFEHDIFYVENQSLWLDLKIVFLTFKAIVDSFLKPVDNPAAVVKRFDQSRHFIRLPGQKDNSRELLDFLTRHSQQSRDFLNKLVSADYFQAQNPGYFLLLDDRDGRYNSFAIFKNSGRPEMIEFFADKTIADPDEMKDTYTKLANLYSAHFKRLKNLKLQGNCRCLKNFV